MVGGPCTGKTYNALKIKDYIEKAKSQKVVLINEEALGYVKEEVYKDPTSEKMLRAKLKSEVEKKIEEDEIYIYKY